MRIEGPSLDNCIHYFLTRYFYDNWNFGKFGLIMTIEISYIIILSLLAIVVVLWLLYFVLRKKYRKLLLDNTLQKELFNRMDNQKIEHFHRAQLNPHLLKNSLNGMLSHAYQTYYTMDKLAMVLDYVLYESEDELVSPKAEIEFARNLIEINKVKLSPLFDIRVKFDIDEVNSYMLNTPSLIPLVSVDLIENAFKHADFHGSDSFISIVLIFRNGWLDLMVSNRISKRSPLQKSKSGIGSKTLEERLMLYYPSRHQLRRFVENDVYNAHLQIKLYAEWKKPKMYSFGWWNTKFEILKNALRANSWFGGSQNF